MDYDDNDILHHNPQLAGEGRSKSSCVLRPYDFPKFDFDDSLQGHLRFDSLVETEVFLGIQSQEDNQWIEDFSPTPADSCSISRRNNVWSEATSSESVEMLLKSVGQEEMMPGDTLMQDSKTCDDQDTVSKHVELGSTLDERNVGKVGNLESTLSQEEFIKNHPSAEEHVETQLCEAETQLCEAEESSQAVANVEFACVSSSNLVHDAAHGKGLLSSSEGSNSYHTECSNGNMEELKSSDGKSMKCGAEENSLAFAKADDNFDSNLVAVSESSISPQVNVNDPLDSCNNDGPEKHVSSGRGEEVFEILERKTTEASIHLQIVSSSLCLVAKARVVERQDAVEGILNYAREFTDTSIREKSEMRSSQEDGRNVSLTTSLQNEEQEIEILPSTGQMDDPFESCQDDSAVNGSEQHCAVLGSSDAPHCASPEKINSAVQLPHTRDSDPMEVVPGTPFTNESISDNNVNKSSDTVVPSPATENKQTDNIEVCHNDAKVILEEPAALLPTCVMDNSKQVIEGKLDHMQANSAETNQDVCTTKQEHKNQHIGVENVDAENVKVLKNDQRTHSLKINKEIKESSASAVNYLTESEQREPEVRGLSFSDNVHKESATKIVPDADFRTGIESVSKCAVSVIDDANRTLHTEISAFSLQPMKKRNDVSSSESPHIPAINSLDSNQSQVDMDHGISLKESPNSELVPEKSHELTRRTEGEKEQAQASVLETDKASFGSPTTTTSNEPLSVEKDSQEQARGSEVADKFVNDFQSSSEDPKRDDTAGDDTSFTFKVAVLPDTEERESGKCWSPFPIVKKCNSSVVVEESIPSGEGKTARTPPQKTLRHKAQVSKGEHVPGTAKGTSERKGRRSSAKGMAKENAKGNQANRTNLEISSGKGDKVSNTLLSASSFSSPHVQLGQMQRCEQSERCGTKVSRAVAVPTTNLLDLNTSALSNSSCPLASFRQPFTDLQQVQLRAQIFVYGSLIQGIAPDEACMVSAFGPSDGGRTIWEPVWHVAIERVRSQKSNPSAAVTPLHTQSGFRFSNVAVKQSPQSSKLLPIPASCSSGKGTPAAVVNPIIPLSSPLWSISTSFRDSLPSTGALKGPVSDYQLAATPMHSFQTPSIRNFVGHASWSSQACFPGPWIASPRTFTTVCFQPVTMTETVKTPIKETSAPFVSGMKHMVSSPAGQTLGPSPVYVGISSLPDKKTVSSAVKHSVDVKARKKKKFPSSDPCQVPLVLAARTEPVVFTNVTAVLSPSVAVPASAVPSSDAVPSKVLVDASAVCSSKRSVKMDLETQNAVSCSEETLTKVAEAKSLAEDAAALAAAAVKHSKDQWSLLVKQKEFRLTSEAEAKVASATVALAAAASVTKAAAAAAKVAYNAVLQAKLMADEAYISCKTSLIPSGAKSSTDLYDKITSQSSSILVAAKEAANRRIGAASAVSKQAENLDAIVKAAELAATAVSQAGKIVAMGEPLPLSELIEAGREGYWKLVLPFCELAEKLTGKNMDQSETGGTDPSVRVSRECLIKKGGLKALTPRKTHSKQRSNEILDGHVSLDDGIERSGYNAERDLKSEKGFEVSDSVKLSAAVNESDAAWKTVRVQNEHEDVGALHDDSIKEGSLVEVFKHGIKSAWDSANVLTLADGKAFVCYNHLLSEKGSGNLCEWVPLECDGDKAPIIRVAHPLTAVQSQGTRKRRRAALGDYVWCVGDRVDVWINDCWWEGVVMEKNEKDETNLKVHFPAQGETSTVRAWNIRTSRLWTDGKWIEWSSLGGYNASEQSDTPNEKRLKMGSPIAPAKGKDKSDSVVKSDSGNPKESKFALSTGDRIFDTGKPAKDDNKHTTHKPMRTGQQKEGSRVIFGVPKPTGKKRKFMEVSKHFSANEVDRSTETNDSVKFAKYLMPQTTTTRAWKAPGRNESKERRTIATRSKTNYSTTRAPSSRKPTCTLPQRDGINSKTAKDGEYMTTHTEDSIGHDENTSEKMEHGFTACEETGEAPLSSLCSSYAKKISSLNNKSERINKGKIVPAGGSMSKIEEDKVLGDDSDKSVSDGSEPRRSNRRIQPTHRLLEGLQSSMIIPKMSSGSHDKGLRNQNRNVSTKGKLL